MTGTSDGRRRKRLSADLPQNWLHDPQYWPLSDRAWRLHTHALMYAIGRTDGFIERDMLSMLLPCADVDREIAIGELEARGIWHQTAGGGWQIDHWEDTQSTVAQIERNRERERNKKASQRARVPQGTAPGESPEATRHDKALQGLKTRSDERTEQGRRRNLRAVDNDDPWADDPEFRDVNF